MPVMIWQEGASADGIFGSGRTLDEAVEEWRQFDPEMTEGITTADLWPYPTRGRPTGELVYAHVPDWAGDLVLITQVRQAAMVDLDDTLADIGTGFRTGSYPRDRDELADALCAVAEERLAGRYPDLDDDVEELAREEAERQIRDRVERGEFDALVTRGSNGTDG